MLLLDLLNASFTILIIDRLFSKYFEGRLPHYMILIIALINATILSPPIHYVLADKLPLIILSAIITIWPFWLLYKGKLYQKVFIIAFYASFIMLCELFSLMSSLMNIPAAIGHTILNHLYLRLLGVFFACFSCKMTDKLFNVVRMYSGGYHIMLICYFFGQYLLYLFLSYLLFYPLEHSATLVIVFCYGVLSALTLLIMYYSRLAFQAELKKRRLEHENKILSNIAVEMQKEKEETIKLRHDIGNHIAVIKTLMETGNSSIAKEYYQNIKSEIEDTSTASLYFQSKDKVP